ncbi:MAG: ATP-binding protein [Verrucomicrobiales bacterium]|nr:ATP-binding protein [Verrucomicrobiales bacterium]
MRSLRTRLALISTFVSGVAIIGVSVLAWYFMVESVRESLDLRLDGISSRLIHDLHPRANWNQVENNIRISYGDDIDGELLHLHMRDDIEGLEIFSSFDDYEEFQEAFPEGFPARQPQPKERPDWRDDNLVKGAPRSPKGAPGRGLKGRKGPRSEGDAFLAEILGEEFLPGDGQIPPLESSNPFDVDPFEVAELATVNWKGKDWRIMIAHERGYYVMVALDLTASIAGLKRLERGLFIGIPLALAFIGFGGWLVAERALRPIRKIAETASHVTAKQLDARMEEKGHSDPEIEHLVEVLNGMMDRLEKGFSHATRFSADVSHELKTPITVMQAEIETALRECEPGAPEENRLLILRGETDRLKSITRSLMLLSQADVGELIRKSDPIDLSTELETLCEDAEIMAESGGVRIESDIESGIKIQGDPTLLQQALLNLINNAIKYNEEEGIVRIAMKSEKGVILISVENTGPGITGEEKSKVFDRFFRADKARSRGVDGFGLGLSLAQAVVEGHGGEISLAQADREWTKFEIRLPVSMAV